MRKTINIESVRTLVNNMLRDSHQDDHVDRAYREGAISVLENLLHDTGNYRGFRYLTQDELFKNCIPGVHRGEGLSYEEKFINTDGTRRYYY
jgi:hypothetical protein